MFPIAILLFVVSSLFAVSEYDSESITTHQSIPSSLVEGKVSAISGALACYEDDYVIAGAEPIHISRTHTKNGWEIIPYLEAGRWGDFCTIWDTGSTFRYVKHSTVKIGHEKWIRFNFSEDRYYTNARGKISGRSNQKNSYVTLDSKGKFLKYHAPDGMVRTYKKIHGQPHFRAVSEKLPNGNQILYEYDAGGQLKWIKSTNPQGNIVYAVAEFRYQYFTGRHMPDIDVLGSDGQILRYRYKSDLLVSINAPGKPLQKIIHQSFGQNLIFNFPLDRFVRFSFYEKQREWVEGILVELKSERYFNVEFNDYFDRPDPRRGRIKTIQAPIGHTGDPFVTSTLIYFPDEQKSSVYDLDKNRTDYSWNNHCLLTSTERYNAKGSLLSAEKFVWGIDNEQGFLLAKSILDEKNNPVSSRRYFYDSKGNVVLEKFYGNFSGQGEPLRLDIGNLPVENGVEFYSRRFSYSADSRNLLIREEDDNGCAIVYEYIPDTSLPSAQFIYDHNELKIRKFWEYNKDLVLIREITDDGPAQNTRIITQITPKPDAPYVGMPWIIEQKYGKNGQEQLLQKEVLTYGTGGRVVQRDIYDAENAFRFAEKYTYDEKGWLSSETNAIGQVKRHSFDELHNEVETREFSCKKVIRRIFDFADNLIRMEEIGDDDVAASTSFLYDKKHSLLQEKSSLGPYTQYQYDAHCNPVGKILPPLETDVIFQYQYDSLNNLTQEIDPEKGTTLYSYNAYQQPIWKQHPDGGIETNIYNLDGTLKSHTDAEGTKTTYTYDFLRRECTKTSSFEGKVLAEEKVVYDSFNPVSKTDAEGNRTDYFYDGAGRLIREELAGEKAEYEYDSLGRRCCVKVGNISTITEYDLLDRVITERTEAGTKVVHLTQYEYDEAGNQKTVIRMINGHQAKEQFVFDSQNRLVQKIDPLGHITQTIYQPNSLNKSVVEPNGLTTDFTFNLHNTLQEQIVKDLQGSPLLIERTDRNFRGDAIKQTSQIFAPPRFIQTSWRYDKMGRMIELCEAEATREERKTFHAYNKRGSLVQTTKPDGTKLIYSHDPMGFLTSLYSSDGSVQYSYVHDRLGRLLSSSDGITGQKTSRRYDAKGRVLEENLGNGLTLASTFDHLGRREKLTLPDRSCVQYGYDGYLLKTIARPGYGHVYHYDLSGRPIREQLIGNLGTLYRTYNLCGGLDSLQSPYINHAVLERDEMGNILHSQLDKARNIYSYDLLSQLNQEQGIFTHSYVHDAQNGRVQKDQELFNLNHLLQVPDSFQYDANGNPIRGSETEFTYDALDRLISAITSQCRLEFTYDSDHRRLSKTTIASGKVRKQLYFYDGQNEIGVATPSGNIEELRILGNTPNAEIGAAVAVELNGTPYLPIHDLYGNVTALLSFKKQPLFTCQYSAFGEERKTGHFPWRYASKRTDDETGLVYFGRRYYDPKLGRWLTTDPAGYTAGINLYAYLRNNPLNRYDAYGLIDYGQWEPDYQDQQRETWACIGEWEVNALAAVAYHFQDRSFDIDRIDPLYDNYELSSQGLEKARSDYYNALDYANAVAKDWAHENRDALGQANKELVVGGLIAGWAGTVLEGSVACKNANKSINFLAPEIKASAKAAISVEKNAVSVTKAENIMAKAEEASSLPKGLMWSKMSPLKNKTAEQLHQMFKKKGFVEKGKDCQKGLGNYINPKNGRQYHIDPQGVGRYQKPNHVDVSRVKNYRGELGKKRFRYSND